MPKKKLNNESYSKKFPSTCLYRDDIEEIIDIMHDLNPNVIIEDGKYQYETLDELAAEHGKQVNRLLLKIKEPNVTLEFDRSYFDRCIRLNDGDNSISSRGLVSRISEILFKRVNIIGRIASGNLYYFISILYMWSIPFSMEFISQLIDSIYLRIFIIVGIFALLIILSLNGYGLFFKINLKRKYEMPGFFTREKDSIIKMVIGAVIGIIFAQLVKLIFS